MKSYIEWCLHVSRPKNRLIRSLNEVVEVLTLDIRVVSGPMESNWRPLGTCGGGIFTVRIITTPSGLS